MDEQRACKRCKAPLRFVTGPNGKVIPLDMRAPVYVIGADLNGAPVAQRAEAYVTHFSTCPFSSEFTRRKGEQR